MARALKMAENRPFLVAPKEVLRGGARGYPRQGGFPPVYRAKSPRNWPKMGPIGPRWAIWGPKNALFRALVGPIMG